jgi:phosphoribosylaminoimidazole-succinocarboxamide synthase
VVPPLVDANLPHLYYRGKVRDIYELSPRELLMVATDRVSAFDVVLPDGIPDKGVVLNQLSAFWFDKAAHIIPNHLIQVVDDTRWLNALYGEPVCISYYSFPPYIAQRSMIVAKAEPIKIECVVRGYLAGSAWAEYLERGTVAGVPLPTGLKQGDKLPQPLFTPTTKEASGHDQPLEISQMRTLLGEELTQKMHDWSIAIYCYAADYARGRGIIIADTKLEFGLLDGKLILIDELLTPDSSRFWEQDSYIPGRPYSSFDKQPLRDWLIQSGWNREPPAPSLPQEVIEETSQRYKEVYRRLTGRIL